MTALEIWEQFNEGLITAREMLVELERVGDTDALGIMAMLRGANVPLYEVTI